MNELAGLQALARSLAHGDADADDLLQDTAIAAIAKAPDDRPVKPWLVTVLLNRWRMDRRSRSRRQAREQAVELPAEAEAPPDAIDRARMLERVASALVALDEPFRKVVIARYLDGKSAAEIARELGIPSATVRWRLKTGLDRLRAALDDNTPKWRALIPVPAIQGAVVVKAKTSILSLLILLLLIGAGIFGYSRWRSQPGEEEPVVSAPVRGGSTTPPRTGSGAPDKGEPAIVVDDPLPGQGRVVVDPIAEGGAISGRVINWSTGEGVSGAELTFLSPAGAVSVRSKDKGVFDLGAEQPGAYSLTTIVAPSFLPYAPELQHSPVRIVLAKQQAVRGITLFLFPAVDYDGFVVDAQGAPVPGAKVKLADPAGEQTLIKLTTEWTTDTKGHFTFNSPDFGVFEASKNGKRGWNILDGAAQTTHKLVIKLGDGAARDAVIKGKTVDTAGQPLAGVLVTAIPQEPKNSEPHAAAFATSGDDGSFAFDELDKIPYTLVADVDDHARAVKPDVPGGTQNVTLTLDVGLALGGFVRDPDDKPVPSFTLIVTKRQGVVREGVATRTVVDPAGRFSVRVPKGDYELLVHASGWAPTNPVPASAGTTDTKITLSQGAVLAGRVIDAKTREPLPYARVQREGAGGGASAQPVNAGTVTRVDGTFELAGIPPGAFTISIGAGNHHPKLEGGLVAKDGGSVGPIEIKLAPLADGETPQLELVGIGVKLAADGDSIRVDQVVENGGAAAAGIVAGDHISAIDGIPVTTLGMDGTVGKIRGVAGTTLAVTIVRDGKSIQLVVERKSLKYG